MKWRKRLTNKSPGATWQRGFTIAETMIVLAAAGVILLIVLEAVPALERSGQNNQRRQDVQQILAAVSHYELNNGGNMPSSAAPLSADDLSKLTYYSPINGTNPQYSSAS